MSWRCPHISMLMLSVGWYRFVTGLVVLALLTMGQVTHSRVGHAAANGPGHTADRHERGTPAADKRGAMASSVTVAGSSVSAPDTSCCEGVPGEAECSSGSCSLCVAPVLAVQRLVVAGGRVAAAVPPIAIVAHFPEVHFRPPATLATGGSRAFIR